ncbi:hypothetical protein NKI36_18015 [Mesorhizobium caraganae]|uniref:Uncharacterized protein n=1 Tax=Mesorhizobium caraganae TaxID=483206 RepID=A0ABV1Z227_9HYPH
MEVMRPRWHVLPPPLTRVPMTLARDYALLDSLSVFSKKYDFVVGHGLGFPKRGLIADGHFSHVEAEKNQFV